MRAPAAMGRLDHLSFKGNLKETRYGWLRLTPAYSVHLVAEILDKHAGAAPRVLDPFCGTGTTALVCAERGIPCDTTDINPFLLWLAEVKARNYTEAELEAAKFGAAAVSDAIRASSHSQVAWTPPLFQIEKWWDGPTLSALASAMATINKLTATLPKPVTDLLKVAFCRTMIERADVSFGHQSMSFKKKPNSNLSLVTNDRNLVAETWEHAIASIHKAAHSEVICAPGVFHCDARDLRAVLNANTYSCVITSPPYPNRMSYIRELRPYMYWLEFLKDGRSAGELDWQAIGGTWGCATSNVGKWVPEKKFDVPYAKFADILERIAKTSPLLSRYVHKYFYDMVQHCTGLYDVMAPGGTVHYVVGNSKFYETLLPVEEIFAALFAAAGFGRTEIRTIRKRSSKKELFEFIVSATKPV